MKLIKTSIHRLEYPRPCGCKAIREYEDLQYKKPLNEGVTFLCEKHAAKSEDAQEILREMVLENLNVQAELESRQYAPLRREVEEGDTAGVVATGESVQAVGATGLPKRQGGVRTRQKTDPLQITKVSVDRSDQRLPAKAATATTGAPVTAGAEDDITITGDIETVPEDPRLSGVVADGLDEIEEALDEFDMKDAGVPRSVLSQAKD